MGNFNAHVFLLYVSRGLSKNPFVVYCSNCFFFLSQQGDVGMKGPLVDNEGYPRSDIDVYAVRQARNKIISEYSSDL